MATPCAPRPRPACLNPVASSEERDRSLTRHDVDAVWRYLEPHVRWLAARALARVPLAPARHLASRRGELAHVIADQGAIHSALLANGLDDLVQDVAVAFLEDVARGNLRASDHQLRQWAATVVRRVAARTTRTPVALLFGAGPAEGAGIEDASPAEGPHPAVSRFPTSEERAQDAEVLARFAAFAAGATAEDRAVLDALLDDLRPVEIARALGAPEPTVRVRIFRALEKFRKTLNLPASGTKTRPARRDATKGGGRRGGAGAPTGRRFARAGPAVARADGSLGCHGRPGFAPSAAESGRTDRCVLDIFTHLCYLAPLP